MEPIGLDGDDQVRSSQVKAAALAHVRSQHREAEASLLTRIEAIRVARSFGATWTELGEAMGMSRQTAHKRFGSYID